MNTLHDFMYETPAVLGAPEYLTARPEHQAVSLTAEQFAQASEFVGKVATGEIHLQTPEEQLLVLREQVAAVIQDLQQRKSSDDMRNMAGGYSTRSGKSSFVKVFALKSLVNS